MKEIEIKTQEKLENGWRFLVGLDGFEYFVTLGKDYWQKLTNGTEEPANLVKRSFEFLLTRESRESILRNFNLKVIQNYFPEYEDQIKKSNN